MTGTSHEPERGSPVIVGTRSRFMPMLKATVWSGGLLVAYMFGMLSAYLVISAVWLGSRFIRALRDHANEIHGRMG